MTSVDDLMGIKKAKNQDTGPVTIFLSFYKRWIAFTNSAKENMKISRC
jgi:hypothetical protein